MGKGSSQCPAAFSACKWRRAHSHSPPQSHLTLYKRGASLGLTVPCSFPLCDAYHSGSVTSLCVGDKGRTRSSCSLITKLIYQADVLLCRLCGVIQWARNGRCTRQGVFYEGLGTNSLTSGLTFELFHVFFVYT